MIKALLFIGGLCASISRAVAQTAGQWGHQSTSAVVVSPGKSGVTGDPLDASNVTFDYIVVGGGLTGLALASRLSEDASTTVLVIEAGDDNHKDSRVYDVTKSGQFYGSNLDWSWPVDSGRTTDGGKTLGGGSSINGAFWTRGAAAQYDAWSSLLTSDEQSLGWNWNNLYTYMKKAEHYHPPTESNKKLGADGVTSWHGTEGLVQASFPQAMVDGPQHPAFVAAIHNLTNILHCPDLNGGDPNCVAFVPSSINPDDSFHRSSSATSYLSPVENTRLNWLTLVNSTVSKLTWKSDGSNTVVGVEFVSSTNSSTMYRANVGKEVIVAAGSINTPAILQRSGVGDAALLSSLGIQTVLNVTTVGKNLQEQSLVRYAIGATGFTRNGPQWDDLLAFPNLSQLFGSNETEIATEITSNLDSWADSQKGNALSKDALKTIFQSQADVIINEKVPVLEIIYANVFPGAHAHVFWGLLPFSRGSVKISTVNPLTKPTVNNNFFKVPFDAELQSQGGRLLRKLFRTPPLANLSTSEFMPGISSVPDSSDGGSVDAWTQWIKSSFSSNSHALGTCSMMRKELGGVADGHLRVYGAKNLRITDASVMPTQISGHMMSTLYGIAEKLADMIKSGL